MHWAPRQLGTPAGAAGSARLTLYPEGEQLLRGARRVLGHTHVAGSISHLRRGNLWARATGLMALGSPRSRVRGPSPPPPAPPPPPGGPPPDPLVSTEPPPGGPPPAFCGLTGEVKLTDDAL